MAYVTTTQSLPRSLDVQISLSVPQTESRTDLSTLCLVAENIGLLPNANRIRFYSTLAAVTTDYGTSGEAYKAASAFFSQTPRANTMAIAEVWLTAQPAMLASSPLTAADITALAAITNGTFDLVYDKGTGATTQHFTAMNFTGVTTIEGVATVIDGATGADLACAVKTLPGGSKILAITTGATGTGKTIGFATAAGSGTDISALANLTLASGGQVMNGYTPTDIASELDNVAAAANANGRNIYGWCLEAGLRDATTQATAAAWALARTAIMPLVTNDLNALDPAYITDIGYVLKAAGNRRAVAIYHDNPARYPDVSILAYMLSVNYQLQDSTVTAKFKDLPGIETVILTETQWSALQAKGYNTFTLVGNQARTYRDGTTESSTYYMDTTINLDNFVEDLSVNVYNVFLRNGKIPYTRKGQLMLVDACSDTGNQYVYNGTFADREVVDSTKKSGVATVPAVQVIPTPIAQASSADRAARIAPPIQMIVQEAGAIHSVAVNVEVVS